MTDPIARHKAADPVASGHLLQTSLQAQGLDLLLAELHALSLILQGAAHPPRSQAEIEAEFDNMPV